MILRNFLAAVFVILCAHPAIATDIPKPSSADSRIRWVNYNEWDVVRVIGTIRSNVQVVFDQGEEIIDVGAGDTVAWEVKPRKNILYLKARETHPPTNLQIATMRGDGTTRTYSFELITREGSIMNNTSDVYFQLRFKYPADRQAESRAAKGEQRIEASEAAAHRRLADTVATTGTKNWRYLAAGSQSIQPVEVFDNGDVTVLTFDRRSRLPSIFIADPDGSERTANITTVGTQIIVHSVAAEFRLRLGKEVLAIYNEGLGTGFTSTGTHTVSAGVEREIIGGRN